MASDTRMGETPPRWSRAQDAAQDPLGMENAGLVLPREARAELGLPSYPEPGKLRYGAEKDSPWRVYEGCLGPRQELSGGRLGCPYPAASPGLRDALCRPKDGAELPLLLPPPRNGQRKAAWAEAVLAPLALYSHAYQRYPLPFPALDGTAGKPGDAAGDPPAFRHCPFLVEAKHSPFVLSSLPAEPPFGGEAPGAMGDGGFTVDWHLGSYVPAWGNQPLYLGLPPRCKAAPAPFDASRSKEFYPKKEPGFHPAAKDQASSQLPGKGQDGDGEREQAVPEPPGALWRDGRAGGSSAVPTPHAHTPPPSASHPLFFLQPSAVGSPWGGVQLPTADLPLDPGPGQTSEPKDEHLGSQSHQPASPGPREQPDSSPPLTDGRYPLAFAKPEPSPACLCPAPGCDGCPRVGCGVLGPFEPTSSIPSGRFPCQPSNHTKLKKTWLTRHSEQSLPCCKAPRWDGGSEAAGEGRRSAKRPHGTSDRARAAGEGAGAAKRGAKATEHVASPSDGLESGGDPEERRMELGEGDPPSRAAREPQEPWCLQSVPCNSLPQGIPRCCLCAARATRDPKGEEEEDPPESSCRLLHFRRFALGDGGELRTDGFCTLAEAEGQTSCPEKGSAGSSLCWAKYLLGVLGDPFCEAVRKDRDAWPGAPGVTAWRRGEGAPRLCDACQRGFFNSHWSCARCGFQMCPDCHRSRQEGDAQASPARLPECVPGRDHHVASLVPTQFVPTSILTRLWKRLHQVRAKFGLASRCRCGEGAAEQSPAEPPASRQELPGAAVPTLPPSTDGQVDPSRCIKEESPERDPPSPGQPPPQGTVQPTTLCDLLASTAVKLCLGQDGVRMAFAPVSPALPSDNRLTSILDSIIARVVERKIQERRAGAELSPPSPPSPPSAPISHCTLAPSGLLWLHDPSHPGNYELFQEHWRQGQPVLVSGLQKKLEERLWGPDSFHGEQEVEVVNLRAPARRLRMSSREFWDGFAAGAAAPEQGAGDLLKLEREFGDTLKLERGFGDMEMCRVTNLSASVPLPEYCGPTGRLNLASHLHGRRWLRPRLCVAYGAHPQDRSVGTKNLTVEAADSITILAHVAARLPARQDVLLEAEADGVDAALKERLWDAGSRPGALWHIFRAEDAGRIQDFLRKVGASTPRRSPGSPRTSEDQGQEKGAPAEPPGCYLDLALRRRLREECGVSGWTLLQFLGDAVLVPAGAPHQVRSLAGTISVEQRFLSPENTTRLREHGANPQLSAQLDGMIFSAVREAVGVLRGCK